jgi:hypothetical protein
MAGAVGSLDPELPAEPELPLEPELPTPELPLDPELPAPELLEPELPTPELPEPEPPELPLEPDEPVTEAPEPVEPADPEDPRVPEDPELGQRSGLMIKLSQSPSTRPSELASPQTPLSEHQPQKGSLEQERQSLYSMQAALRHAWKNHSVQLAELPEGPERSPVKHSSVLSHHPHPLWPEQLSQLVEEQDWAIVCEIKRVARTNSSHKGLIFI